MTSDEELIIKELYQIRDRLASYANYDQLLPDLNGLLKCLPITLDGFENKSNDFHQGTVENYIYRARPLGTGEERYDTEKSISYLPECLAEKSRLNRANRDGDRVFYGSLGPLSAMIETYASGEHFQKVIDGKAHECVIGCWKVIAPISFAMLPFAEKTVLEFIRNGHFVREPDNVLTEKRVLDQADHIRSMLKDEFKLKVLEFFSEAFAFADNSQYMLSTYYTERIFNRIAGFSTCMDTIEGKPDVPVEGILYHAVPSSYEIRNVVLPIATVKTKLKLVSASHWRTWFNKADPKPEFHPIKRYAPVRDGKIIWNSKV